MTELEMWRLAILLRKPIPWDPGPPWLKLTEVQQSKFVDIQNKWNAKLAEIETQKIQELAETIGVSFR